MKASVEWLRELSGTALTAAEMRDVITARVATVDSLDPLREDLAEIVIALVVAAGRHPDSEHLSVTRVDDGSGEILDVVCGAPNVRAGAKYPFARPGTVMPDGLRIERRRIRGQVSNGMLCSARELRLGEDHAGILELDTDAAPGTPFLLACPTGDYRLDIDVAPNRPDLLSHLGVAREIAAATAGKARFVAPAGAEAVPVPEIIELAPGTREGKTGGVTVRVDDADVVRAFNGVVIRGVKVGPSPDWLAQRILAVGGRPINNVVDATNYMLHGVGQPMHAFDLARLAGASVIARCARPNEKLVTLDGVERELNERMTVIADAERAQAIAGIMGGRDSEVTVATTDIFLEVASFEPRGVRHTRRALGLSTDASYRFERGVAPQASSFWARQAARLIVAVAGGRVDGPAISLMTRQFVSPIVDVRVARVERVLGIGVEREAIVRLLASVGFVEHLDDTTPEGSLRFLVPHHRADVTEEIDLIEEVARLHGYERIPDEIRPFRPGRVPDDPLWIISARVRDALVAAGLYEARPMPFVTGEDATHVRVANPLAENEAHLRVSLLESLARRAEHNLAHKQGNVRLFEIGAAFLPLQGSRLPREELRAAALVLGDRHPSHFAGPGKPPAFDAWDAKFLAEVMISAAYPGLDVGINPAAGADRSRLWDIVVPGRRIGSVRQVALDAPVWASPAFGIELQLGIVPSSDVAPRGENVHNERPARSGSMVRARYHALPAMPAAEFDIALLVPPGVLAAQIEAVLREAGGDTLESLTLFDEFSGPGIPAGHRSLGWRLTFRHPTRTLRDKEIEGRRSQLLKSLANELGVRPRTQ